MDIRRSQVICLFIDNYHDLRKHLRLGAYSKALRLSSLILSLKGYGSRLRNSGKALIHKAAHPAVFTVQVLHGTSCRLCHHA